MVGEDKMADAFTFSIFLLTVCNSSQITGYIELTLKLFCSLQHVARNF